MSQATTNRRNRNRGKSFEKRVAEKMGNWYRIAFSGSSELFGLGDVRDTEGKENATWMVECKTITPRSAKEINYIIKEEWLIGKLGVSTKAKKEYNKFWALAFTKKGSPLTYIAMSIETFRTMVRALEILKMQGQISNQNDSSITSEEIDKIWEDLKNGK